MTDKKCFGVIGKINSEVETPIFCEDAKNSYQIVINHSKMNTNGELRFRLNCEKDHSAYIRTETTEDSKGWQNPHYHKGLYETYIVQLGRVIFVEVISEKKVFKKFNAGDIFTTKPQVAHNIYMDSNSVIHTLKHGTPVIDNGKNADWYNDSNECECISKNELDSLDIESIDFSIINDRYLNIGNVKSLKADSLHDNKYTEGYRHFDKLIWQVPLWATGIFSLVFIAFGSIIGNLSGPEMDITNLSLKTSNLTIKFEVIAGLILLFFSLILFTFSYTLLRFRCHQSREKRGAISDYKLISPQLFLHLILNLEGFIFIVFSIFLFFSLPTVIIISIIVLVCLTGATWRIEYTVKENFGLNFEGKSKRKSNYQYNS